MKIAIDARSLEGGKTGVGRYLENILKVWKGREDCQFLLYFKDGIPEDDFLNDASFTLKKIDNFFGFSSNFFFQHFLLPHRLRKDGVDFFFSPFYLRPFFCPAKSAIVLHDISYEAHPEWFDWKSQLILRTLSKISAGKADLIFTVSEYSKSEIVKYYGIRNEKIIVTPLAADEDFTRKGSENNIKAAKEKYGLDKFILCVGTVFTRRHVPELIEAFGQFTGKDERYRLCIVGKNKTFPYADIDGQIEEVNLQFGERKAFRIDFASEEELAGLYGGSDAVVYLSDYEGFGLPVIEAQSLNKPVITSFNTSLAEVGGDSVEFVLENKTEHIFAGLEKVLGDEKYRESLIEKGRKNLGRFSWTRCGERTLEEIIKNV